MHILVKTLTGKSLKLEVNPNNQVAELNNQIETLMGVPSAEQKLVFNQRCLLEGSLFENGLEEESNVYMIVHIEGGAKGKKKKKDVKKGKKKHKKKKVKLAILRYYKVEGEKVVRLRQQCRKCPPGTFLADHADRLYCGRCRSHYVKNQEVKAAGGKKKK